MNNQAILHIRSQPFCELEGDHTEIPRKFFYSRGGRDVCSPLPLLREAASGEDTEHDWTKKLQHWATTIKRRFLAHAAQALEFGLLVYDAKIALEYGGWENLFRRRKELELPFGKSTGKKWAEIGEVCWQLGQEPDHLGKLPGGFEALYQLSRLGVDLLRQAIDDGEVTSALTEAKAREVVLHYKPELAKKARPFNAEIFLEQLRASVDLILEKASDEDLCLGLKELSEQTERALAERSTESSTEIPQVLATIP